MAPRDHPGHGSVSTGTSPMPVPARARANINRPLSVFGACVLIRRSYVGASVQFISCLPSARKSAAALRRLLACCTMAASPSGIGKLPKL